MEAGEQQDLSPDTFAGLHRKMASLERVKASLPGLMPCQAPAADLPCSWIQLCADLHSSSQVLKPHTSGPASHHEAGHAAIAACKSRSGAQAVRLYCLRRPRNECNTMVAPAAGSTSGGSAGPCTRFWRACGACWRCPRMTWRARWRSSPCRGPTGSSLLLWTR